VSVKRGTNEQPSLGAYVRRRRKELGLTQAQLGERLGFKGSTYVSDIENGKELTNPTQASLERLADALEVSLSELVTDAGLVVLMPPELNEIAAIIAGDGARERSARALIAFLRRWGLTEDDADELANYATYKRLQGEQRGTVEPNQADQPGLSEDDGSYPRQAKFAVGE
jgi:transcriptional regulator with XRE-family HTH domain